MKLEAAAVHRYFAAPDRGFWLWQDDDPTAGWCDQVTIAFGAEINAVLDRFAPLGLPPLDAVLLVLAACRESWSQPPSRPGLLYGIVDALNLRSYRGHLATVLDGLDRVHACRRHVNTPAAKAELAAMIFEGLPARRSAEEGAALLEAFRHGHADEEPTWEAADTRHALRQAIGCLLGSRLSVITEEALVRRLKTGLEELPAPVEIETPPAGTARELLVQLQDDQELGGVARLAKLLLAVVQLPRAVSDPDELPLGGVSDIANRGTLDRLLLSELAHDDLTLAVRVALNEALYLRREAPPHTPPRERLVLLDSGIRLWGVPRVFATAVGLALAAASEKDLRVTSYRASGSQVVPVDFSTSAGVEQHLRALDHRLHPGEALAQFVELAQERHDAGDVVLVTDEDAADDPKFREALARVDLGPWYLVTVARDGRFRLEHRGPRGSKLLREATLALDEVLKPRRRAAPLLDPDKAQELPEILRRQPFPLRLSANVDVARSWHVHERGVLTLTNDRRLLFWEGPSQGAAQLAEGLPQGRLHWAASTVDSIGFVTAVIGKLSQRGLHALRVNLQTGECHVRPLELEQDRPVAVAGKGGKIFVMFQTQVEVLDPVTGKFQASKDLHGWTCLYKREYAPGQRQGDTIVPEWRTLMYDGHQLNSLALSYWRGSALAVQRVFDRAGTEGPVGIGSTGEIYTSEPAKKEVNHGLQPPIMVQSVSRDGQRVILGGRGVASRLEWRLVDVPSANVRQVLGQPMNAVEEFLWQYARPRMLRTRFHGVAIGAHNHLTLLTRKGAGWRFTHDPQKSAIVFSFVRPEDDSLLARWRSLPLSQFRSLATGQELGYTLHEVHWPEGSRTVLDSRGLLHLRSSDASLPEFSIVLADGITAGWSADGRWWGPEYFIHPHPATAASEIYDTLLAPFVKRLLVD